MGSIDRDLDAALALIDVNEINPPKLARWGDFELELSSLELRRQGKLVALQHQPTKFLAYLVTNSGRVIPRLELQEHLWGDRHLDAEQGLNNAIRQIRKALGDRAEEPRFLETVPRVGYRFIAPVVLQPAANLQGEPPAQTVQPVSPSAHPGRSPWSWRATTLVVLCLIVAWIAIPHGGFQSTAPPSRPLRLAVLPLEDLDGGASASLLKVLGEEISTALAQLNARQLRVISPTSSQRYAANPLEPLIIAQELRADLLVEGGIHQDGQEVVLLVRVLRADTDGILWGERFSFPELQVSSGMSEVAAGIAGALAQQALIDPPEIPKPQQALHTSAAWGAFVEGRFRLSKGTPKDLEAAREEFRRVTTLEPGYAPAWLRLAEASWLLQGDRIAGDEARSQVDRALELDPVSGEAHLLRAEISFYQEWDGKTAEKHYRKALDWAGGLSRTHLAYAFFLALSGQAEAAIAEADQALELDPISPAAHGDAGLIYLLSRDYRKAVSICQRTLELELEPQAPNWFRWCLLDAYTAMGDSTQVAELAVRWWQETPDLRPRAEELTTATRPALALKMFYAEEFRRIEAREDDAVLTGLKALAAARAGETEKALHWLEVAHQQRARSFLYFARSPVLDPLRQMPRYRALLEDSPLGTD